MTSNSAPAFLSPVAGMVPVQQPAQVEVIAPSDAPIVSSSSNTLATQQHDAQVASQATTSNTTADPSVAPVVPAADRHLEQDATVLPLGQDVDAAKQARHLDEAPDHVVKAEVEKVKAADREMEGHAEGGTVVLGLEDDKLWALLRRWNVQVTHVLSPPTKLPLGEPDLRPSTLPDVPFNSDIVRSNLERLYTTAGVSAIYSAREMGRLMSWSPEERRRTAAFCIGYFISAWFSMVIPALMALLIVLTVFPPSRIFLFPPIKPPPGQPVSALDPTGKKGDESKLAGVGEPITHRSKAEQIEQQAWEFTNTVQRFGIRVVMGGTKKGNGNGEVGRKEAVDSSDNESDSEGSWEDGAVKKDVVDVVEERKGKELTPKQKRKLKAKEAKIKRDAMVGSMAKGTQDAMGDFADALERFHNMLSPPRVYPKTMAREKFAGAIFVPIMLATAIIPCHFWAQAVSFSFGIGFFGQPILIRAGKKFVELVPDWQEKLDLRNSLLSGVPTNAQVTIHVLREAEAHYDPLPEPPAPPTAEGLKNDMEKGGLNPEEATHEGETTAAEEAADDATNEGESTKSKIAKKGANKLLGGLRLAAKKAATFRGDVTVDNARAKVGTKVDRILYQGRAKDHGTPESFPAKLNGTSGHLVIKHQQGLALSTIAFVPLSSSSKVLFEEPINDLVELKKRGVFIGRMVLGWASGVNLEGMGLEMRFKPAALRLTDGLGKGDQKHEETHNGDNWEFSHVGRRDALFTRLVSIGAQKWESL